MTMDMSGSTDVTDYSDYEYQEVSSILEVTPASDNDSPNVQTATLVEPLGAIGGLDNNEVAELVYLETMVDIEYEAELATQTVATTCETRGSIGINLTGSSGFIESRSTPSSTELVNNSDNATFENQLRGAADDQFLQLFQARASPPFDGSSSPGSGAAYQPFNEKKNWRDLTNRGPVLDSTDDISIHQVLNLQDCVTPTASQVRLHMVWDTAEVSDAGRAFSVP